MLSSDTEVLSRGIACVDGMAYDIYTEFTWFQRGQNSSAKRDTGSESATFPGWSVRFWWKMKNIITKQKEKHVPVVDGNIENYIFAYND